jgi:hypothetical protein
MNSYIIIDLYNTFALTCQQRLLVLLSESGLIYVNKLKKFKFEQFLNFQISANHSTRIHIENWMKQKLFSRNNQITQLIM